jgi:hypothetical protein
MKKFKTLTAVLATVSVLTFAVGPIAHLTETNTVQASSSNYDVPVGTVTKAEGTITVVGDNYMPIVRLYSFNGDTPQISASRSLLNESSWYTDEYKTAPNRNDVIVRYYRVSTNEWVISSDVERVEWVTAN